MAVSRFATEPGEGAKPGRGSPESLDAEGWMKLQLSLSHLRPIRACHGVASPAIPSPKQAVRRLPDYHLGVLGST